MQTSEIPVYARDHTLLGICEALGEDLGFNPLLLRVPLATLLLWNPTVVIATYFGLGALVLITRWLAPNPRVAAAPMTEQPAIAANSDEDMALAA